MVVPVLKIYSAVGGLASSREGNVSTVPSLWIFFPCSLRNKREGPIPGTLPPVPPVTYNRSRPGFEANA